MPNSFIRDVREVLRRLRNRGIELDGNRQYPAIPTIDDSVESHTNALRAMREAIETHERRNPRAALDSFVRLYELEDVLGGFQQGESSITNITNVNGGNYTGINLGAGAGVYKETDDAPDPRIHKFRSLMAGSNITVTQNADTISISATLEGGSFGVANIGGASEVWKETVVEDGIPTAKLRTLIGKSGITVRENTEDQIEVGVNLPVGPGDVEYIGAADLTCGRTQTFYPSAIAALRTGDLMVWVVNVRPENNVTNWSGATRALSCPTGWVPYATPKYYANREQSYTTAVFYRWATAADKDPATSYSTTGENSDSWVCGRVMAYRGANQRTPLGAPTYRGNLNSPEDGRIISVPATGESAQQCVISVHSITDNGVSAFPTVSNTVGPDFDSYQDTSINWLGFAYLVKRIGTSTVTVNDDENWIPGENPYTSTFGTGWTPYELANRSLGGTYNQYGVFSALGSTGRHYLEREVSLVAGEKYSFWFKNERNWSGSATANQNVGISYVDPSSVERGARVLDGYIQSLLDPAADHNSVWFASSVTLPSAGIPSEKAGISILHFTAQATGVHKIRCSGISQAGSWTFTGATNEGWRVAQFCFRKGWRWPSETYTDTAEIAGGSAMRQLHVPGWLTASIGNTLRTCLAIPVMPAGMNLPVRLNQFSQIDGEGDARGMLVRPTYDRKAQAHGTANFDVASQAQVTPTLPVYPVYDGQRRKFYCELTSLGGGYQWALHVFPLLAAADCDMARNSETAGLLWAGNGAVKQNTIKRGNVVGSTTAAVDTDFGVNGVLGISIDFTDATQVVITLYRDGNLAYSHPLPVSATSQWHPDEPWSFSLSTQGYNSNSFWSTNFQGPFLYEPPDHTPWDPTYVEPPPAPTVGIRPGDCPDGVSLVNYEEPEYPIIKGLHAGPGIALTDGDECVQIEVNAGPAVYGGISGNKHPDNPPLSPTTFDDEFNVTSPSSIPGWTLVGSTPTNVYVEQGIARIRTPNSDTNCSYYKNITAGAFKFRAKMALAGEQSNGALINFNACGIWVRRDSANRSFRWQAIHTTTTKLEAARWSGAGNGTAFSAATAVTYTNDDDDAQRQWFYFEIEITATELICRISRDGVFFYRAYSELLSAWLGGAPDRAGFFVSNGGATYSNATIDWIRAIPSGYDTVAIGSPPSPGNPLNDGAEVRRTTDLALSAATWTVIPFDAEIRDDNGYWAVGSPGRFVAPYTGWYAFTLTGFFGADNVQCGLALGLNGSPATAANEIAAGGFGASAANQRGYASTVRYLARGDYVEAYAYASATATLAAATIPTVFSVHRLGVANQPKSPDSYPSAPRSLDDEFETAALDPKWAWRNQGAATATLSDGHCLLYAPNVTGSMNLRGIEQTVSGTFRCRTKLTRITVGAAINTALANYFNCGIYVGVSGSGKLMTLGKGFSTSPTIEGYKLTNASTFSSSHTALTAAIGSQRAWEAPLYLEVEYDGTNVIFRLSDDGVYFQTVFSEAATTFLGSAPDRVGIYATAENASNVTRASFDWFRRVA